MSILYLIIDFIKVLIYLYLTYRVYIYFDHKLGLTNKISNFILNIFSIRNISFLFSCLVWLILNFILNMKIILSVIIVICINLFLPGIISSFSNTLTNRKKIIAIEEFIVSMIVSLKSGMTLIGSISNAVTSVNNHDIRSELETILVNYNLGMSLDEAIHKLYKTKHKELYEMIFNPILICLSYGGNLVHILEKISKVLQDKKDIERKLYSLTSQVRIQAGILIIVSPAILIGYFFFDRRMFSLICSTSIGHVVLTMVIVLELIGVFFIRKMMNISEKGT